MNTAGDMEEVRHLMVWKGIGHEAIQGMTLVHHPCSCSTLYLEQFLALNVTLAGCNPKLLVPADCYRQGVSCANLATPWSQHHQHTMYMYQMR